MRAQDYPGSDIVIESELERGANYRRYYAWYESEGLKIYGLLTIPDGEMPEGGLAGHRLQPWLHPAGCLSHHRALHRLCRPYRPRRVCGLPHRLSRPRPLGGRSQRRVWQPGLHYRRAQRGCFAQETPAGQPREDRHVGPFHGRLSDLAQLWSSHRMSKWVSSGPGWSLPILT